MSLEVLDDAAIREFVEDEPVFRRYVRDRFSSLANGSSFEELEAETKAMMLAVANGVGFLPMLILLEEGSFLRMPLKRASD